MHFDLNSCFATVEQQANPHLRGKPIAVAAYTSANGCILAASVEAKRLGIKTGMRVKDGKLIYKDLIVLPSDPDKYRFIHRELKRLISQYTDNFAPKSIDEFVLNFEGYPAFNRGLLTVGRELKQRIKEEIGDWLTVSVGLAPNRFLAKTAAGLHKPDGLDEINHLNYADIYSRLSLIDLCGIDRRNAARLQISGIYTVTDLYHADVRRLRSAFHSVIGYYWYLRLRGWEIDAVEFGRKSFGHQVALGKPLTFPEEVAPLLSKLVVKMAYRLRKNGYQARGLHLGLIYRDGGYWQQGATVSEYLFDSRDLYKLAFRLLCKSPYRKPLRQVGVSCFDFTPKDRLQLGLFEDILKKERLNTAVDGINGRWGNFCLTPARMISEGGQILDRIAFGNPNEL